MREIHKQFYEGEKQARFYEEIYRIYFKRKINK